MGKTTAQKGAHVVKDGIRHKDVYATAVGDTTKAYFCFPMVLVVPWVQVLIELLVGRPPAVLAQDGHSCVFLSDELRPKEERFLFFSFPPHFPPL